MIAATILAIIILMGGDSMFGNLMSNYIEDPIESTIKEKDRREMALDAYENLQDAISELNEKSSDDKEKLNELVENYESTPQEFDALIAGAFTRRGQEVEVIWKQRSAMLVHINADEWKTIINSAKAEVAEDKK